MCFLLQVICVICDTEQPVSFDLVVMRSDDNVVLISDAELFVGGASVRKLRGQYGGVLLRSVQILRRRCEDCSLYFRLVLLSFLWKSMFVLNCHLV